MKKDFSGLLILAALAGAAVWWGKQCAIDVAPEPDEPTPVVVKKQVVFFTQANCAPCKQFEQTTLKNKAVVEALREYVVRTVRIDLPEGRAEAKMLDVTGTPTVVMQDGGKVIGRREGYVGAKEFLEWLKNPSVK